MGNGNRDQQNLSNLDPITGASASPPIGTAAGRPSGEVFNRSVHDVYWREMHTREPYYRSRYTYADYAPGYRTGYEGASRYMDKNTRFDDVEPDLRANYDRLKGKSRLTWEDIKDAARAAWERVERVMPGDLDNDGR